MSDAAFEVTESVALDDGGVEYAGHPVAKAPAPNAWNHVVWNLSFTGQAAFSNVEVDGTVGSGALLMKSYLAPADILLGIVFAYGVSGPWAIRVDNVVVDVK
jgi:hypothetical protein